MLPTSCPAKNNSDPACCGQKITKPALFHKTRMEEAMRAARFLQKKICDVYRHDTIIKSRQAESQVTMLLPATAFVVFKIKRQVFWRISDKQAQPLSHRTDSFILFQNIFFPLVNPGDCVI